MKRFFQPVGPSPSRWGIEISDRGKWCGSTRDICFLILMLDYWICFTAVFHGTLFELDSSINSYIHDFVKDLYLVYFPIRHGFQDRNLLYWRGWFSGEPLPSQTSGATRCQAVSEGPMLLQRLKLGFGDPVTREIAEPVFTKTSRCFHIWRYQLQEETYLKSPNSWCTNGVVFLKFFLPNPTESWGPVRQGLAIADPVPQTSNGRFKRRWCWGETLAAVILRPYFFSLVPGAAASCLRNMCRETWRWFFRGGLFFDDLGYELGLIQHSS